MQKCIVTGSNGFVGKYLIKLLKSKGLEVVGWDLPKYNLIDKNLVDHLVYYHKPDYIFHLAAKAFVPSSFQDPQDVLVNNIIPAVNIFEAVRKYGLSTRILCAGSSEEYGLVNPEETPIKESNELRPQSPYAISKITMELLGKWYADTYKLNIITTRAFNHSGAGRPESYMTSSFAKQVTDVEKGLKEEIRVGNLDAKRDITDVRDMVEAYWLAINKCKPGESYNISSGETHSAKEILEKLIDLLKNKQDIKIIKDKSRMRPSDVPILQGDNSKFVKQTGWKRKYKLEDTLLTLLEFWRKN